MKLSIVAFGLLVCVSLAESKDEPDVVPICELRLGNIPQLQRDFVRLAELAKSDLARSPWLRLPITSGYLEGIAKLDETRPTAVVFAIPNRVVPLAELLKFDAVAIVPIKPGGVLLSFGESKPPAERVGKNLFRWRKGDSQDKYVQLDGDLAYIYKNRALMEQVRRQTGDRAELIPDGYAAELTFLWSQVPADWKRAMVAAADDTRDDLRTGTNQQQDELLRIAVATMSCLVQGTESVTFRLRLRPEDEQADLQLQWTAVEDSALDSSLSIFSRKGTRFSELFRPDAALNVGLSLRLNQAGIDLLRLFDPKLNRGVEVQKLIDDPGKGPIVRKSYEEFQETLDSVTQVWMTLGRIETALSLVEVDQQTAGVGAITAVGAEMIADPAANFARQAAVYADQFDSNRLGDLVTYRYGNELDWCYAKDVIGVAWGQKQRETLARKLGDQPQLKESADGPAVFVEGDLAYISQLRSDFVLANNQWMLFLLPKTPPTGRFRLSIVRGEHHATADLQVDEAAIAESLLGLLKR